jgi:hypothetical protein
MALGGVNAFYVFKTNVDASEVTDLGQVDAASLLGSGPTAPIFVGTTGNGGSSSSSTLEEKERRNYFFS